MTVPVPGGSLAVTTYAGASAPVLAIHGVSSNSRLFSWLHAAAPELTLLAPDLRGRGGSFDVERPVMHRASPQAPAGSSLARHADDMVAVLDASGVDSAVVCGMSMGGFVAVTLALRHPDRVRELVLVDGGLPMASAAGLTPEAVRAAFAPQASRREHVFADLAAYREFFLAGPNLLDPDDPLLGEYLAHDLGADGRVRLDGGVLLDDAVETLLHPPAWQDVAVPIHLLAAEWSAGRDSAPAYPDDAVERFRREAAALVEARRVAGVDHGASIMTARGAGAVAEVLRPVVGGHP